MINSANTERNATTRAQVLTTIGFALLILVPSLIGFANREFYGGKLVVPPNVRPDAFSIDVVRAHGSYKAGRNAAEIVRVVAAAIDFMIRNAELPPAEMPTLGIATLGREQRDAICDEFHRMARTSTDRTAQGRCLGLRFHHRRDRPAHPRSSDPANDQAASV